MKRRTPSTKQKKTSLSARLTHEERLRQLEKAWGYVEVNRVTLVVTGERRYCARNYSGSLIDEMSTLRGLPGNPTATRKIEITGRTEREAVQAAHRIMRNRLKEGKRELSRTTGRTSR